MSTDLQIEELLRWRMNQAMVEAPPAPRAAHLLDLSRPWWETWPAQFQALAARLARIHAGYGHAMAQTRPARAGYPVAVVIVEAQEEWEVTARVLYVSLRKARFCLRFQLEGRPDHDSPSYEVTFVSADQTKPLFLAAASLSLNGEYSLFADIPPDLAHDWSSLRVTEKMPFRLILRQPVAVA